MSDLHVDSFQLGIPVKDLLVNQVQAVRFGGFLGFPQILIDLIDFQLKLLKIGMIENALTYHLDLRESFSENFKIFVAFFAQVL